MDFQLQTIEMDKYTQFRTNFPAIKQPRWSDQTLLINANVGEHNKVLCTLKNKDDTYMFPDELYVSGQTAKKYKAFSQTNQFGHKVKYRAVPIKEFKVLKISARSMHEL